MLYFVHLLIVQIIFNHKDNSDSDRMVVVFTTDGAISAYRLSPKKCEFESCSWRDLVDTTLCDEVYQLLMSGLWFSPGTPVS